MLIPTRLQLDHGPQRFGCKGLSGVMKGYGHAAPIRVKEMLMGPGPPVDHKAIAKQGVDEAPGGQISQASIVDHIKP